MQGPHTNTLNNLTSILQQRIATNGPVPFRDFMEWCLYYPDLGYYAAASDRIGKAGDYYTSPYVHSIFGNLIGKQLAEMWEILGKGPFTIVEYGAGTGMLCQDILRYLSQHEEFYSQLKYVIIEKSAAMRGKQQSLVREKVIWIDDISSIEPLTGCILSNELLDNFAVHQVVMQDELMEVMVDFDENGFKEKLVPASPVLKDYFTNQRIVLIKGSRAEVNLQALDWISTIGKAIEKGFVLTIDYGFPANELYNERRRSGTLMCYHHHTTNENPYINIGEQDITVHVNFTALKNEGEKAGLQFTGFTSQAHFLHGLGIVEEIRKMELAGKADPVGTRKNAFVVQSLLMNLGTKIRVLVQHKGITNPQLSGLRFPLEI
jgi:SAM-dependent MidA family methyltransferase